MSMIGSYSDIDLRIIVKDEFFEEYRANKKQRAKNWGNVLFYEDDPLANYSVAHFSSFIKVDSFYYQTEEMQPSIWLQNIRITHDTDGMMRTFWSSPCNYYIRRPRKTLKYRDQSFLLMFTKSTAGS
ncbi:hypothetical protein ABE354_15305 [Brevibacillus laterosporus]|uniref:hypothetical protein n=1 Tax=Brevibacillus laterosporus TaxID=1465 RepID=UPI003D1CF465